MSKIIISYRRSDSDVFAGRIRDRLAAHFGEDSVFIDVDSIPFETDFRVHIQQELAEADAVLVVVGPRWLGAAKGAHSRIMDSTDPVRIEVETALSKGIPTIPILVGKTPMPKTEQLPESLRDFSFINAAPVDTGRDFHRDVDRVIATLDTILGRPLNVEGIGRLQASGAHAKARAGTDKTGGETRNSPKFLALVIGGLVFFGIFSGATWLLWVAKARNPAAVTSQLAGPANVGAEQGNSVATSTSSQGTSHNPADQLPVTAASPNVSGPQGNSPATSVGSQGTSHNPADQLPGTYRVQGTNPNGSTYHGQVTITANGSVYNFRWRISKGDIFVGSGRLGGRIISVDWGQQYSVVYHVDDDGTLRGTWANGKASEDPVPIR